MLRNICLALGVLAFALAACSPSTPTAAEEVGFATACADDNKGQLLAVQGYLRLPDSFTGDQSVVLRLYETADLSGTPIGVQIRFGSEPNQVEMVPLEYSDEDLKVHLADGQVVEFGTPVKVSGKVYFPAVDQDFECGLENPLVEAAN
jgi:hypothetical protein